MSWLAAFHPFLALNVVLGETPAPDIETVARYGFIAKYLLAFPQYCYIGLSVVISGALLATSFGFVRRSALEGEPTLLSRIFRGKAMGAGSAIHGNQGPISGDMASKMQTLADGLVAFRDDMDTRFANTTVVVISEFGRRVEQNGSGGTDHGTAGTMFVLGGGVNGGQVYADWVGLDPSVLEDGIDLPITIDSRDVLGEILQKRAANSNLSSVFPGHSMNFQNIVTVA